MRLLPEEATRASPLREIARAHARKHSKISARNHRKEAKRETKEERESNREAKNLRRSDKVKEHGEMGWLRSGCHRDQPVMVGEWAQEEPAGQRRSRSAPALPRGTRVAG
jgi:hypothetical protein